MRTPTSTVVRALALAVPLAAVLPAQQTVVSPAEWTDKEAPSGNAFPFGSRASQFRYLNIHDDMVGTPRAISALAVRRSATTSTSTIPAYTVTLDAWMSTAVTTGATVSATFDNNHGADKAQVVTNGTFNFPAAGTGFVPYDFLYRVTLDSPFPFTATGPLCWEVQITANTTPNPGPTHDYVANASANPNMAVSRYGQGCIATGRTDMFGLTGFSNNDWNLTPPTIEMTATAQDGPANAPAVWLLGFDPNSWAGLPLPLPLPGTAGGTSGVCEILAPGTAQTGAILNSSGDFTYRLQVPANPVFDGLKLFSQTAALDTNANALGIVTSNGLNHQIVAPYAAPPGGRVYESGSLDPTGTANTNTTLIVQFTY